MEKHLSCHLYTLSSYNYDRICLEWFPYYQIKSANIKRLTFFRVACQFDHLMYYAYYHEIFFINYDRTRIGYLLKKTVRLMSNPMLNPITSLPHYHFDSISRHHVPRYWYYFYINKITLGL